MLAQNNHYFKEASDNSLPADTGSADPPAMPCREDYNRTINGIANNFAAQKHEISTLKKDLDDANQQFSEKDAHKI